MSRNRLPRAPAFVPHPLTRNEIRAAKRRREHTIELLGEVPQGVKHWHAFLAANPSLSADNLDTWDYFAAQLETRPMGEERLGTTHEYLKQVSTYLKEKDRPMALRYREIGVEELRALALKQPGGHAPDYPLWYCKKIYEKTEPNMKAAVFLNLSLGMRASDEDENKLNLENVHLRFNGAGILTSMVVTVTNAKNIHSRADQRTVIIPAELLPGVEPPADLVALAGTPGAGLPCDCDTLNRTLEQGRLAARLGKTRGKPTSYTLRRNFVHRVIARCRLPSGEPDWDRVKLYTLHFREQTIRGHYELTAADLNVLGKDYDPWS